MIYKWNETNLENFLEVLRGYLRGDSFSKNKILEVQDLKYIRARHDLSMMPELISKEHSFPLDYCRFFISSGIDLDPYIDPNDSFKKTADYIANFFMEQVGDKVDSTDKACVCRFSVDNRFLSIKPLYYDAIVRMDESLIDVYVDIISSLDFGEKPTTDTIKSIVKIIGKLPKNINTYWFTKDKDGNRIIPELSVRTEEDIKNKMVRYRTIDFEPTWRRIVEDRINEVPDAMEELAKDDLKPEQIKIVYEGGLI
jgi:hypothetical protein